MRDISKASPGFLTLAFAAMLLSSLLEGIGLLLLVPVLTLLGVGAQAETGSSIAQVIDRLLAAVSVDRSMGAVLGIFLAVIIMRSLVSFAQSALTARFLSRLLHQTRMAAYEAISHAKWQYIAQHKASGFAHAIASQAERIASGAGSVLGLATSVIFVGVGIAVSLVVSPYLTGLIVALATLLALPMLWFDVRAYRLGQQAWKAMSRIFEQIANIFQA